MGVPLGDAPVEDDQRQTTAEGSLAEGPEIQPGGSHLVPTSPVSRDEFESVKRDLAAATKQCRTLERRVEGLQSEAQGYLVKINSLVFASDLDRNRLEMEIRALKEENRTLAAERDALRSEKDERRHQTRSIILEPALVEACRALDELASAAVRRYRQDDAV